MEKTFACNILYGYTYLLKKDSVYLVLVSSHSLSDNNGDGLCHVHARTIGQFCSVPIWTNVSSTNFQLVFFFKCHIFEFYTYTLQCRYIAPNKIVKNKKGCTDTDGGSFSLGSSDSIVLFYSIIILDLNAKTNHYTLKTILRVNQFNIISLNYHWPLNSQLKIIYLFICYLLQLFIWYFPICKMFSI